MSYPSAARVAAFAAVLSLACAYVLTTGVPRYVEAYLECEHSNDKSRSGKQPLISPDQKPSPQIEGSRSEERDEADVCAQQRMAQAARDQARFTYYGLWLLGFTLAFTAIAAWAARQTVQVMSETAQRQLRAYVNPIDVEIKHTATDSPAIIIAIKNAGATPAYKVTLRTGYCVNFKGPPSDKGSEPMEKTVRGFDFGPAQTLFHPVYIRDFIWGVAKSNLNSGTGRFFVTGRIEYEDIFAQKQWTRFRYEFFASEDTGVRDGKDFAITAEGNEST